MHVNGSGSFRGALEGSISVPAGRRRDVPTATPGEETWVEQAEGYTAPRVSDNNRDFHMIFFSLDFQKELRTDWLNKTSKLWFGFMVREWKRMTDGEALVKRSQMNERMRREWLISLLSGGGKDATFSPLLFVRGRNARRRKRRRFDRRVSREEKEKRVCEPQNK